MINLLILTVLTAAIRTRAEIAYQGGLDKGPLPSGVCGDKYNPAGPLYNVLLPQYSGKYPNAQAFVDVSETLQNDVEFSNPSPPCGYGCIHDTLGSSPLIPAQPNQFLGVGAVVPGVPTLPGYVMPQDFATFGPPVTLATPPVVLEPPIPPAPDPPSINEEPSTSHIMKIPRKCQSSSITITLNTPDTTSSPSPVSNSIYPSFSPTRPTLTYPSRPYYYSQPPPLLASCPATVFYPATIPYSVYPASYTCPAHPPSLAPPVSTVSSFPAVAPTAPTNTISEDKTIASFTSNIPDTRSLNITTSTGKRDPLLTFKLLTAAASKSEGMTPPPISSLEAEAASRDCSMPIPPVVV